MKAVILAAGKGTRMGESSNVTPKPMLQVLGKTLLEHKLDQMPEEITEVIIVVGHLKNKITDHLGGNYEGEHGGKKITYVVQDELLGTAHSLSMCKEHLLNEKKFIVMMGDDIYSKEDMEECLDISRDGENFVLAVREVESIKGKAKVFFDEEGNIKEVIEKYPEEEAGFVTTGMYGLTPKIFDYEMKILPNGEYGLPQTIVSAKNDINIKVIQSRFWLQITTPEDLKIAETFLSIR